MAANGRPARTLLVLWDVDGTLVDTAGHGRHAFGEAFAAVFGRQPADDPVPMAGRTDHAIALDLLARNSIDDPERHLPEIFEALHDALHGRRDAIAAEGRPQPGVAEALSVVGARADVLQSLLTGNIERNARIKLGAFGLERARGPGDRRLRVRPRHALGAGGHRTPQGTRAPRRRRARLGHRACGRHAPRRGGRAQGRRQGSGGGHGPYRLDELEQAGPDAALEDLRDTEALLAALEG